MRNKGSIIIGILIGLQVCFFPQIRNVFNNQSNIEKKMNRIELDLVHVWGGEGKGVDEDVVDPRDIAVAKDGSVFIADARMNRIQVFSREGKYIRTIGRKGQGPGEMGLPGNIFLDTENNLWISDLGNRKIHCFSSEGKLISEFSTSQFTPEALLMPKNQFFLVPNNFSLHREPYLFLKLDLQGKNLGFLCDRKMSGKPINLLTAGNSFCFDPSGNIAVGFHFYPHIDIFSQHGKKIRSIDFESPFPLTQPESHAYGNSMTFDAEKINFGISIDEKGYIFLLSLSRQPSKEEKKIGSSFMSMGKDGTPNQVINNFHKVFPSEDTDLYRLLVFDPEGKIVAVAPLQHHFNRIKVFGDRIFLIDSHVTMKIYEYSYRFVDGPKY